jgi:dipeptidyl aminopeptidase/acylaminoacyl peptidase
MWLALLHLLNKPRALTIEDILKLKTISEVQISPDGKWVAYTVSEMDMKR